MKNVDKMSKLELRGELRATRGLLARAKCPECDGSGTTNPAAAYLLAYQCQWCAERSVLIGVC